jgi:ABC-2 type transport system permease protein
MRKEFLVLARDHLTLFFMFFPPLLQLIAFGFALDLDVKHIPTLVFDEDRTRESRELIDQFMNTRTFKVLGQVHSIDELAAAIRRGEAYVGLQIPPGFARDVQARRTARIQALIDGSSSSVASSALNTALNVGFRQSMLRLADRTGVRELPVEVRPQMLYNPEMRSPNFFLPGVIGLVLQIATLFATSMSLVRERERGTLEQLLVSPLSRWGLMLGKITPYLCLSMFMAVGLIAIMQWVFNVPVAGDMRELLVATLFYLFALLSIGLLISTWAQNQLQALQMCVIFILPTVFFSGFIFPRETMPWIFWAIGVLLPATYYIELQRAIVLRGAGLADFWVNIVVLAGMGIGVFSLCALQFKRKIA